MEFEDKEQFEFLKYELEVLRRHVDERHEERQVMREQMRVRMDEAEAEAAAAADAKAAAEDAAAPEEAAKAGAIEGDFLLKGAAVVPGVVKKGDSSNGSDAGSAASGSASAAGTELTFFSAGKEEEEEPFELPGDVFTAIFFAPVLSATFAYGCSIYGLQLLILSIITFDLVNDDNLRTGEDDGNNFNVPVEVDWPVRVAQILAILISVTSRDDCTDTFTIMVIGWKKRWWRIFPGATIPKYFLMNFLRFSMGAFVIVVSFIFIVQSDNVLDLFLNFAAIEFVANLDNLAYEIAEDGWFSERMGRFFQKIEEKGPIVLTDRDQEKLRRFPFAKNAMMIIFLGSLYVGLYKVQQLQASGTLLESTSCGFVDVVFGDEVFSFLSAADSFDGFKVNETNITESNYTVKTLVGSTRTLGINFNESLPPDLQFATFAGGYQAFFSESYLRNRRPVYYERGFEDPTSGLFFYCDKEKAWVFTVPALAHAGALPEETIARCGADGWLLRSPVTEEYALEAAPVLGWKIWTGALIDAVGFSVRCAECSSDIDCGVTRGSCEADRRCKCGDQYGGVFCNEEAACDTVLLYANLLIFPLETNGLTPYGRPMYAQEGDGKFEALLYTGRRWYDAEFNNDEFSVYDEGRDDMTEEEFNVRFTKIFHGFWGGILFENTKYFSDDTSALTPAGSREWTRIKDSGSIGSYGTFGVQEPVQQRLECLDVDCSKTNVCGEAGNCTFFENITYGFFGSVIENANAHKCVCEGNHTGHFCEYSNDFVFNDPSLTSFDIVLESAENYDPWGMVCLLEVYQVWWLCLTELYV